MALTVTLEFAEEDLDYFRSLMHRVRDRNGHRPPHEVAAAAIAEVERLRSTARSPFIRRRIDRVARLVAMLEDPEWQLPEPERGRVLDGLAYVCRRGGPRPGQRAGARPRGRRDHAGAAVAGTAARTRRVRGVRRVPSRRGDAPRQARVHRPVSREDWLASRREALHARIRERRDRDLARDGEAYRLITRF